MQSHSLPPQLAARLEAALERGGGAVRASVLVDGPAESACGDGGGGGGASDDGEAVETIESLCLNEASPLHPFATMLSVHIPFRKVQKKASTLHLSKWFNVWAHCSLPRLCACLLVHADD